MQFLFCSGGILERRMELASPKAYMKSIGVFPKINKDTLHKTLMSGKNPYSDLVKTTNKGFSKVGEDFVKRRMELAGKGALDYATKAAKASKYGKIAGAVATAGIAASAYLRSKMKDIKEKQQSKEPEGKMGGGMMKKYSKGESVKLSPKQMKIARMRPPFNEITGDDFKAMKANVGKSVKGYGQARKSGMGLEDENISLGKGSDYIKDLL